MGMTMQRRAILDVVMSSDRHMTAEEVFTLVRQRIPAIGLGTVYRNLNLLADTGEIWRFSVPGEPDHFDRNTARHGHVFCVRCQRVEDLAVEPGLSWKLPEGFAGRMLDYELVVRCVCADCEKREREITGRIAD